MSFLLTRITRNLRRFIILILKDFLLDMIKGTRAWTFETKSKKRSYIAKPVIINAKLINN